MPAYDYHCKVCDVQFEARHGFNDPMPPCPNGHEEVERLITTAPRVMQGVLADAGMGGKASKEQLRAKWAEETPKLRENLVKKLGEDVVNRNAPSLNHSYD
jgi:putative FmdB family regulatory protein